MLGQLAIPTFIGVTVRDDELPARTPLEGDLNRITFVVQDSCNLQLMDPRDLSLQVSRCMESLDWEPYIEEILVFLLFNELRYQRNKPCRAFVVGSVNLDDLQE